MFNPADHYVHVLAVTPGEEDNCRKRIDKICSSFEHSPDGKRNEEHLVKQACKNYNTIFVQVML